MRLLFKKPKIFAKRKRTLPGRHSERQWRKLKAMFSTCPRCGKVAELTKDHIVPRTWDGSSDWISNIQPLCRVCNSAKNNYNSVDYRPEHVKEWAAQEAR